MSEISKDVILKKIIDVMVVNMPKSINPSDINGEVRFFEHASLRTKMENIIPLIARHFSIPAPDESIWPAFPRVQNFVDYIAKAITDEESVPVPTLA